MPGYVHGFWAEARFEGPKTRTCFRCNYLCFDPDDALLDEILEHLDWVHLATSKNERTVKIAGKRESVKGVQENSRGEYVTELNSLCFAYLMYCT